MNRMKVSNKKSDVTSPEVINPEVIAAVTGETAMVPQGSTALAAPSGASVIGHRTGDVGETRLQLPTLAIAYGVGKLAEKFSQGDLVLTAGQDEQYLLVRKNEPLIVTFVSEHVYWKEYLSPEQRAAGARPVNFANEAEAKKAGHVTQWPPRGTTGPKPTVAKAGIFQMLIQKPKDLQCTLFAFEMGGALWAPARWFLDKGAFKNIDAALSDAVAFGLRSRGGNLIAGRFEVRTTVSVDKEKGRTNCLPTAKLIGGNTDAELAEIVSAFRGNGGAGVEDDTDA
jgi:hypothetical protein